MNFGVVVELGDENCVVVGLWSEIHGGHCHRRVVSRRGVGNWDGCHTRITTLFIGGGKMMHF